MEEVENYGKVRRIKYGASIHGDNKDMCGKEQVWGKMWGLRTHWTKGENKIKYEGVEE